MILSNICENRNIIIEPPNPMHLDPMTRCFYYCYITSLWFRICQPLLELKYIWRGHFWVVCMIFITNHYIYRGKHKYISSTSSESLRYDIWSCCFPICPRHSYYSHLFTWEIIANICNNRSREVVPQTKWII